MARGARLPSQVQRKSKEKVEQLRTKACLVVGLVHFGELGSLEVVMG